MKSEFFVKQKNMKQGTVDEFMPTLSITHVHGEGNVKVTTFTGLNVGSSPADLAEAFLEFVCASGKKYTRDELASVTDVVTEIHQRYYRTLTKKTSPE